jgi:hypothetical protein
MSQGEEDLSRARQEEDQRVDEWLGRGAAIPVTQSSLFMPFCCSPDSKMYLGRRDCMRGSCREVGQAQNGFHNVITRSPKYILPLFCRTVLRM